MNVVKNVVVASACFFAVLFSASSSASSHREAPFITESPKVDGTDFYMFRSYESGREGFVTLIANYLPGQNPYDGPNYYFLDPEALYEIHIDNDGDAKEDITFAFDFTNTFSPLRLPIGPNGEGISVPLINTGAIGPGRDDTQNLHLTETYTVSVAREGRSNRNRRKATRSEGGGTDFKKPVDNIGNKSIANYPAYANSHIYSINIPGCDAGRVFVGQRREGFVVNLGEIFDLFNTDPFGPRDAEPNVLDDKNVSSIALEVPVSCLTAGNNEGADPVIGGWTTSSLRQVRVLNRRPGGPVETRNPRRSGPAREAGVFSQISRLGSPLINEVVIGIDRKDRFNTERPHRDLPNFGTFVTHPTLPEIIKLLFPSVAVPATPRADLVAIFVTGIETEVNGVLTKFTKPAGNVTPGEMLRLNTAFPPAPTAPGSQNDLGVLACDLSGFPNGRRPYDDVVDIELTAAMGAIAADNPNQLQNCNVAGPSPVVVNAGNVVTDGARPVLADYLVVFPYLNHPLPGSPNAPPVVP